jgi:hypothetical protein
MASKKQTVKEEVKPVEHKRDNSNDIGMMMACIMQTLDEMKRSIKVIEMYQRLEHGGDV